MTLICDLDLEAWVMNSIYNTPASDVAHLRQVSLNYLEATSGQEKVCGQMETSLKYVRLLSGMKNKIK